MNPFAIGIGSVLVIGLFVGLAFAVGILHVFEKTYSMQGVFSDASGMRNGSDVRVAGIKAGRVTSVKADRNNGNVVIKWSMKKGVHLGPNTHAEVALQTLLGTKYLRLTGPVVKPYMEDLPKSRRVVPLENTKTPFDVFELTRIGTRSVQQTDTDKLNELIKDLANITEGKHDQLETLLNSVSDVTATINQREDQLRSLIDRLDALSNTLAEKDQTIVALLDQSQRILDLVEQRRNDIASQLENTNGAVGSLADLITTTRAQLNSILNVLHPVFDILDRRAGQVNNTLAWLGDGALNQAVIGRHGPWQDLFLGAVGPEVLTVLCEGISYAQNGANLGAAQAQCVSP
jgi:phospholipid/cholesterol/gamma-HCH transport system substrate-binding protein